MLRQRDCRKRSLKLFALFAKPLSFLRRQHPLFIKALHQFPHDMVGIRRAAAVSTD